MGMISTASLYCRLSASSDPDSTGLRSQETALRELAEARGLTVVAVHVDDGQSGALRNRPGFLAWLRDGREGRADHLLAWKLDRVSRGGPAGLARFLDTLKGLDADGRPVSTPVRFLSAADGLDSSSSAWSIQSAVMGALAETEREQIRGRIMTHRATAIADGRVVGGRRPWPFAVAERPGGGSCWVPVPERAEAIRWAAAGLAGGELSTADVVREWTRRGLSPKGEAEARTSSSGAWHQSVVRRLLASPTLYGASVRYGEPVRNADGTVRIDPGQAILSLGDWQALQAALARRSSNRAPSSSTVELLAGLVHCATCGRLMYPHRAASGRTPTYRCRGAGCERPVSVAMRHAEAAVTERFLEQFGDVEIHEAEDIAPVVDAEAIAAVAEALAAVDKIISADDDEETTLSALRQRRQLRARLAELQDVATTALPLGTIAGTGETYGERWHAAETTEDRNALLRAVWSVIVVAPGVRGGRGGVEGRLRLLDTPESHA